MTREEVAERGRERVREAKARAAGRGRECPVPFATAMAEAFGAEEARVRLGGMVEVIGHKLLVVIGVEATAAFVATIEAL